MAFISISGWVKAHLLEFSVHENVRHVLEPSSYYGKREIRAMSFMHLQILDNLEERVVLSGVWIFLG